SPSTTCLVIGENGELMTYSGLSWGVRSAFISQLLRPYARLRQRAFPIVRLAFQPQKDDRGNYRPTFNIVGWKPRSVFAEILGEEPLPPMLDGPPGVTPATLVDAAARAEAMLAEASAPTRAKIDVRSGRDAWDKPAAPPQS